MTYAFVFPGQGSQAVGMGKELFDSSPIARAVFEEVDEALHQNLSHLIFEGPEDELTLTENAQPALMAVSIAALRVLEDESGLSLSDMAAMVAGHSLGEYSALAAAGTFSLADTARLLKIRGQAMQRAVPVGVGGMAALLGLDLDAARAVADAAAQGEVCAAANDNAPGQVVVSGHRSAVERAVDLAKEQGARRAVMLSVSAPFHCSLMAPAADAMAEALSAVSMAAPIVPLVANVTAASVTDPDEIRKLLVRQVTGAVRWRESVQYMHTQGVVNLVEMGASKVLSAMTRRIEREMKAQSVGLPAEIEAFVEHIQPEAAN